MNDNQLGNNIKHLRQLYSETLEELGIVLYCAKSTVKGYENGSRKPDLQTLKAIASHYNIMIDELLYSDLTKLENFNLDLNSLSEMSNFYNQMFPLYYSANAMKNINFKKGYEMSQKLIKGFAKGEILPGNMIVSIFMSYLNAVEDEVPEAFANLIWSIFIWWTQIFDINQGIALQDKLLSKKLTIKDFTKFRENESLEIKKKREGFIADVEEIMIGVLKELKKEIQWSEVADYYLALRYIIGMVDTGLSNEVNSAIGNHMMLSFAILGNKLAFRFLKTFKDA